jgi:hypothetical protein
MKHEKQNIATSSKQYWNISNHFMQHRISLDENISNHFVQHQIALDETSRNASRNIGNAAPRLRNIFHASLMSQRWNTSIHFCNIRTKHLQHPYETSETRRAHACNMHKSCRTPWMSPRRRDCLPASSSHPLLLSADGTGGASRRRELRARPPPPPHIKKKGRRRPWAAAAHPAVGGARWRIWLWGRAPPPEESPTAPVVAGGEGSVCWRRRKKEEREMVGGWLFGERSVRFFPLPPDVRVRALPFYVWFIITVTLCHYMFCNFHAKNSDATDNSKILST